MFSRKKKFFALSIALLCVSCLLFTGCGASNNTPQTPSGSQSDNQTGTDRTNTSDIRDNNTMNGADGMNGDNMSTADKNSAKDESTNPTGRTGNDAMGGELHKRAEKIADAVTREIAQVKDSRVVISEHMAYVSVEIDKTADSTESMNLKDEVSRVTKKTDSEIDTVYVMEDANTFTRMKEIGRDIADGKPVSGFVEELENLFVRVTPTPQA